MLEIMIVATEVDIRAIPKKRQQLSDESPGIAMVSRRVDRMMPEHDLPSSHALAELVIEPGQLRRRDIIRVEREKLGGTRAKRVIGRRHRPSVVRIGVEDLSRGAVGQLPVVVSHHGEETEAE